MYLALIYTKVGEYDEAIDQLITCSRFPHLSPSTGCAPTAIWDPLRDHPRFQALLERYA